MEKIVIMHTPGICHTSLLFCSLGWHEPPQYQILFMFKNTNVITQ